MIIMIHSYYSFELFPRQHQRLSDAAIASTAEHCPYLCITLIPLNPQ
jgi:hypothetical protein